MIKRMFSAFTMLVFFMVTVSSFSAVNAAENSFTLDISAADTAVYGDTVNAELTLNGLAQNTAVIGIDIYEISYDDTVLQFVSSDAAVSLENWEIGISVLNEKYGRGYIKIMATVSSADVKEGMVTQNGVFKISLPFKVIGVPSSGNTQIKINGSITGADSSYEPIIGTAGVSTANINIEKADSIAAVLSPVIVSKDSSSVTLKAVDGYEYSINGNWQKSNIFSGLSEDTQYTFSQRIAETETHKASSASGSLSTYTRLDMSSRIYGVLGAQIRKNGANYDLRFISNIDRSFVANKLSGVTEFGVLMVRADQRGDDEIIVELQETADYTVKNVPINYLSTAYSTSSTYTFTVTVLAISDFSREYVIRPYFILHDNVYYAQELGRCINDGLK